MSEHDETTGSTGPAITYDDSRHAYLAHLDGEEVGTLEARDEVGVVVMPHTVVADEAEGHGVGSALVRRALDDVRQTNRKVDPQCPFVAGWIERHPEYADLVTQGS